MVAVWSDCKLVCVACCKPNQNGLFLTAKEPSLQEPGASNGGVVQFRFGTRCKPLGRKGELDTGVCTTSTSTQNTAEEKSPQGRALLEHSDMHVFDGEKPGYVHNQRPRYQQIKLNMSVRDRETVWLRGSVHTNQLYSEYKMIDTMVCTPSLVMIGTPYIQKSFGTLED